MADENVIENEETTLPEGEESGEELEQEELDSEQELGQEESEELGEDGEEEESEEEAEEKLFSQKDLDDKIAKRLARERRKLARETQQAERDAAPLDIQSNLDPKDFSTTEEYIDALANERVEATITARDAKASSNKVQDSYDAQVDEALEKYPDYIEVAHQHAFMTDEIADVIKSSEIATELAYKFGSDLKEAERICKLPPTQQIKAMTRMEMGLETSPNKKKTSSAPTPIKPVRRGKVNTPTLDTTDPRSLEKMSPSEWIAADRKRRGFTQ